MAAFQPYQGVYEFAGVEWTWRCYATTRIHEIRRADHAPLPIAPAGQAWVQPPRRSQEPAVLCLVDRTAAEFSQILLQVRPEADACAVHGSAAA